MVTSSVTTIDCDYVMPGLAGAYLRVQGDEAAFIETNTSHAAPKLLAALRDAGLSPEQVRWVIVTHVHLDHAGGASALMKELPNATLLAHPRAARHLIDPSRLVASATQVYGAQRFAELYGTIDPIDAARVRALDDGASVELGGAPLRFLHTRGHANHHFVVVDPTLSTVYTGDTFGLVYPRLQRAGLLAFPSTSPTDFDAAEARRSIDLIASLGVDSARLTHLGEVRDIPGAAAQLHRWINLSESLVQTIREGRAPDPIEPWLRAQLDAEMARATSALSLDDTDRALLAFDLDLNAQGLAVAARK